MTGLLTLNSPTVWPSFWGGWVVDDGSMPVHVADRRMAYAEAAVRPNVPPAGEPSTTSGLLFATPSGAGSDRSSFVAATDVEGTHAPAPACVPSTAPGCSSLPPERHPGATKTLTRGEEVGAPGAVGAGAPTGANTNLFTSGARS
jgi:hypothetical protein